MNELKTLLKLQWRLTIGGIKYGKRKRGAFSGGLLLLAVALMVLFSMASGAYGSMLQYSALGVPQVMLFPGVLFALVLSLMMAILRGASSAATLDADLLLSLPLRRTHILLAKSVAKYLFELLFVICLLLPYIVVYVVFVDQSLGAALRGLLVLLLLPLLTVGVSYIFSFIFFKLGSKMPNPQTVTSVLSILLIVGFIFFNFTVNSNYSATPEAALARVETFAPARWGMEFIALGRAVALLLMLLITLLPFAVGVRLHASIYGVRQQTYRSPKTALAFKQRTPLAALLFNEAKRYFGSPVYLVNTIIGPVIMVILTVLLVTTKGGVAGQLLSAPGLAEIMPVAAALIYSVLPATAYIAACSISIEGRRLWILRSLPLAAWDIFRAKIAFNLLVAGAPTVLCSLAALLTLGYAGAESLMIFFLPLLSVVLASAWGLYINLLFPKLDWDNETAVVKQSLAALLAFFIAGLLIAAPPAAYLIWLRHALSVGQLALLWGGCELLEIMAAVLLLRFDGERRFAAL